MKHLLLTTAIIAAGATGAFAESHGTAKDANMTNAATSAFMQNSAEGAIKASDFIGMRVYAAKDSGDMTEAKGAGDNWEDIGEINDIVMSKDGKVEAVLVDIGGFLGIGERQVAVNLDQVKFVSDSSTDDANDFFLVLNADPATLKDAPEYDAQANAQAKSSDTMTGTMPATDTAKADMNADKTKAEKAADNAGQKMEKAGDKVEKTADNAGDAVVKESNDMAKAADKATDGEKTAKADANATMNNDQTAKADVNATTNADTKSTDMAATTTEKTNMNGMSGTPVGEDYLTAENLDGARVYDSNDKWVGEISELIVSDSGQITDAIVDVGGFLGIGEKPVALKLSDLQILRQDGSDDVRIYTAMAEDDLKAMPTFEKK